MAAGGEDPGLLQVGIAAIGKLVGGIVVGIGSLIFWVYRRLDMRVQTHDESLRQQVARLNNMEERLSNAPSREEVDRKLDQIHEDIRGVHTRLDRIFEGNRTKE